MILGEKVFVCPKASFRDFWLVISISEWKAYFYTSSVIAGRCRYGCISYYIDVWSGKVYVVYTSWATRGTCTLHGRAGHADLLKKYWEPERIMVARIDGKHTHSYYKCRELVEYTENIRYSRVVSITVGADLRTICKHLDSAKLTQTPRLSPCSFQHLDNNTDCHKYCCEVARKYPSFSQIY